MKPFLIFAILLSLSLHDICQIRVSSFNQHSNSRVQIITELQDFEPGQSLILDSVGLQPSFIKCHMEKSSDQIVYRAANLQSRTFRNQLLSNFNTAMLKNLRKSQPVLTTTLNDMKTTYINEQITIYN